MSQKDRKQLPATGKKQEIKVKSKVEVFIKSAFIKSDDFPNYFFLLLEINKLAKRVTGTASTDMSAAAPVLMLCLFLLLEVFSLIVEIMTLSSKRQMTRL